MLGRYFSLFEREDAESQNKDLVSRMQAAERRMAAQGKKQVGPGTEIIDAEYEMREN